jgi:hypothetical protein
MRQKPGWSSFTDGNSVIPVAAEVSLDHLPAGTYRLHVQASDAAGHPPDWRATCFTVE